jgi:hypothetical protein
MKHIKYNKKILEELKLKYWYWPDSGEFMKDPYSSWPDTNQPRLNHNGYLIINYKGKMYFVHKLIYYFMGFEIPDIVDHIDLNKINNSWVNLRAVDKRQNNTNQPRRKDNTSGYKGVYFHKSHNKWMARISHHNKMKFLGYATTPEEAAIIYNEAVPLYHGEHGWRNPIGR